MAKNITVQGYGFNTDVILNCKVRINLDEFLESGKTLDDYLSEQSLEFDSIERVILDNAKIIKEK